MLNCEPNTTVSERMTGLLPVEIYRSTEYSVLLFRLSMLHSALEGMAESPRVLCCAQIVPVLLHVYFNTITQVISSMQT